MWLVFWVASTILAFIAGFVWMIWVPILTIIGILWLLRYPIHHSNHGNKEPISIDDALKQL